MLVWPSRQQADGQAAQRGHHAGRVSRPDQRFVLLIGDVADPVELVLYYQVVRSIGLTVGSALSAAVLMARTRPGQALPDVDGFKVALIIAAALCLATGVVSFVLPGRAPTPPNARSAGEEEDLGVLVRNKDGLGGVSPAAGGKPLPPGPQEDQP